MNFRKMIYGIIALSICCSKTQALKLPDNNPQDKGNSSILKQDTGNSSIFKMEEGLKESLAEGRATIIRLAQIEVDSHISSIELTKCINILNFIGNLEALVQKAKNEHEKEIILPAIDKLVANLYIKFSDIFKTYFKEYNSAPLSNDVAYLKKCLNTLELNKTTYSIRYKDSLDYKLLNEYIIYISSKIHNLEELQSFSNKKDKKIKFTKRSIDLFLNIKKNHNIVLSNTQDVLYISYLTAWNMKFHLDILDEVLYSAIGYRKSFKEATDKIADYIIENNAYKKMKNHYLLLYACSLCYHLKKDILKENGPLIGSIKELKEDLNKINEFRALFDNCLDIDFIKNDLRTTYDELEKAIEKYISMAEYFVTSLQNLIDKTDPILNTLSNSKEINS